MAENFAFPFKNTLVCTLLDKKSPKNDATIKLIHESWSMITFDISSQFRTHIFKWQTSIRKTSHQKPTRCDAFPKEFEMEPMAPYVICYPTSSELDQIG